MEYKTLADIKLSDVTNKIFVVNNYEETVALHGALVHLKIQNNFSANFYGPL